MEETKNSLLGFLKDSGVSAMVVGRVEKLIEAFNGNIPQFVIATHGQLEAAYNRFHPMTAGSRGLGDATYDAFDKLVRRYKESQRSAKAAESERQEVERRLEKAATENLRSEILDKDIDLMSMSELIAWMSMKFQTMKLKDLLEWYDRT